MEKVISSQLHAKKLLEKQLSEIEARQRQSEVRRLRQIRDLGVDLSKIQTTSRDLDEVIYDLSPRHQEQRRGSLPPLDFRSGAPHFLEQPRTPRSKRRLSCMAAISPTGSLDPEYLGNVLLRKESPTKEKHGHLPPILTPRTGSGSTSSSVESEHGRESSSDPVDLEMPTQPRKTKAKDRHSSDNVESRLGKRRGSLKLNEIGSNVNVDNNTVDVNLNLGTGCEDEEAASPSNHISDSELKFVFSDAKRNSRRSSEPELRSYFIRGMHDMSLSDVPSFLYPGGEDSENLRKSIRRNLPSDIVAETDEDEVETDSNKNRITNFTIDRSTVSQPRAKLSSISESDQDGEHKEDMAAQDTHSFEAGCKEELEAMNDIHKFKEKKSFKLLRHRRKSDGDVMLFDNTRKFSREDRYQPGKSTNRGGGMPLASSRMRYNCVNKSQAKRDIWQDMKECRYLRGYDPPEMNEPDEAVKFVFGHRNKD